MATLKKKSYRAKKQKSHLAQITKVMLVQEKSYWFKKQKSYLAQITKVMLGQKTKVILSQKQVTFGPNNQSH